MSFTFRRFTLILSWIGFAAIILFINQYINPKYNHPTITVVISLLCFINGGLLLTGLLGINKIVRDKDMAQWKTDFSEENHEVITQIQQQILLENQQSKQNDEDPELKLFNDCMEKAKLSWKTKVRAEFSLQEEFWFLQNRIRKLKKTSEFFSLLLSVDTGLLFLNASSITGRFYFGYAAILLVLILILSYSASVSKKSRKLRKQIYPNSVEGLLNNFHNS